MERQTMNEKNITGAYVGLIVIISVGYFLAGLIRYFLNAKGV